VSAAEKILDRLEGVKPSKPGSWLALCPAHDDRSPSLSIRELADGRVLIHCFAGCEVREVLEAIELKVADLFDRPRENFLPPTRGGFSAAELLTVIWAESWVVATIANEAQFRQLVEEDYERLMAAACRIWQARGFAYGK
jgi:hypothetical protein